MAFEVVWDGAHRGIDADLLCAVAQRRETPPATPRRAPAGSLAARLVAQLASHGPQTVAQLVCALETREPGIRQALWKLQTDGKVRRMASEAPNTPAGGKAPGRYAWIGGEV